MQIMQMKDTCTLIMKHLPKQETGKYYVISTSNAYPMMSPCLMMSIFCSFHIENPQRR
jgi:hypothetical protein